jgi:hypothetical protein
MIGPKHTETFVARTRHVTCAFPVSSYRNQSKCRTQAVQRHAVPFSLPLARSYGGAAKRYQTVSLLPRNGRANRYMTRPRKDSPKQIVLVSVRASQMIAATRRRFHHPNIGRVLSQVTSRLRHPPCRQQIHRHEFAVLDHPGS